MIRTIVFDLDDTLFDTTGQLVGPAQRDAVAAMIGGGLEGGLEELVRRRWELGRLHPHEDADLLLAGERMGEAGAEGIAAVGRRAFLQRRVPSIEPFPGTLPTLRALRPRALVLLTVGHHGTQQAKVDGLALREEFDEIVIVDAEDGEKGPALAALLDRRALVPDEVLVVGDRLDREIRAGRRLGCWTCRVEHGEGAWGRPRDADEQPHYTVGVIEGVVAVVDDIDVG